MTLWAKITGPWLVYIKLGIIAALVGLSVYITRNYYEATQERVVQEAVVDAVREVNRAYAVERERRAELQRIVDDKLDKLATAISGIQITHTTVYESVKAEAAANPQFYRQEIPKKGYEQWLKARQAMVLDTQQRVQVESDKVKKSAEELKNAVESSRQLSR